MGALSPLRKYLVNLRQSLRPMPSVNGAHVAERRRTYDGSTLTGVKFHEFTMFGTFFDHVFPFPVPAGWSDLQERELLSDLEESSLDSKLGGKRQVVNIYGSLQCTIFPVKSVGLRHPVTEICTRSFFLSSHDVFLSLKACLAHTLLLRFRGAMACEERWLSQ